MSYRISSRGNRLIINRAHWGMLLRLAERYGWTPLGTLPPPMLDQDGLPSKELPCEGEWDARKYYPENVFGPTITDCDTLGLQDALRRGKRLVLAERRRLLRSNRDAEHSQPVDHPPMWLINKVISFLDDGKFYIDDDY